MKHTKKGLNILNELGYNNQHKISNLLKKINLVLKDW